MVAWQFRVPAILFAALLGACATPVSTNIKASAANVTKYNNLSDLDVVATLEKNVNEAKAANMPFLAPHYFQEAAQVLAVCQTELGAGPKAELVNNAAKGDAILEKGRAVMEIVKYRFVRELELKSQLDDHEASKLLPKEYERVIGNFSGLIEKVEREQATNIDRDKEALQTAMLDVLIKAIQESVLREPDRLNADSKKKNAERQIPVTYAEALKIYQDARTQIAAAYGDQKLVQRLGAQALFAARHAQQVNERVSLLQSQLNVSAEGGAAASGAGRSGGAHTSGAAAPEKLSLEQIVLQEEDRLRRIATALGVDDLRDRPLDRQVEEITRAASSRADQSRSDEAIRDLKVRLKAADEASEQAKARLAAGEQQLAANDQQLAANAKQLAAKDQQLTDRDTQIKALNEKLAQLANANSSKAEPPKAKKSGKQKKPAAVAH